MWSIQIEAIKPVHESHWPCVSLSLPHLLGCNLRECLGVAEKGVNALAVNKWKYADIKSIGWCTRNVSPIRGLIMAMNRWRHLVPLYSRSLSAGWLFWFIDISVGSHEIAESIYAVLNRAEEFRDDNRIYAGGLMYKLDGCHSYYYHQFAWNNSINKFIIILPSKSGWISD